ncbi:MAG: glutamate--tRNA ligase family protein [Candidatus Shikimatogenerans bostrichidophilus]|nr:MAG: glutamate--tRNA ligase family protein [Candidatus Shikimatogenerans bostrichidophilus]
MKNFIKKIIDNDIKNGLSINKLKFRFSPEPNGFLHIGHIKSLYINFKLSKIYNSKINLRFDDTNPNNINKYYVNNIIKDIKWLGFKYNKICYTSNYFNILYKWAIKLIKLKKAYIQKFKNNKIYNIYNIKKNIYIFKNMKIGKYNENTYVLRAKINMKSKNFYLNDPIMYRIIKKPHFRTNNKWYIYPTYDWAHGQSDYIEKITHSLCSIEFQNHKLLYNWFIKNIYNKKFNKIIPKQIEFSRLNIIDSITSKRKLKILKKKKIIKNYYDPRLCTISSFKKKGYKPNFLINFIKKIGYSKRENNISINKLDIEIKKKLINKSNKLMVIINPIKITIINYPKNKIKWIKLNNNKKIPFTKKIYIEKKDFKKNKSKNFFRLNKINYVRLKYSFIIKLYKIKKKKIYCKIYNKNKINKYKIKSTIQWISNKYFKYINILFYKYIYFKKNKIINLNTIKKKKALSDITINNIKNNKIYQFHRIGFFYLYKKNFFKKILLFKKKKKK